MLNDLLVIQITAISLVFLSSFLKVLIVHDCQVTLHVIAVRLQPAVVTSLYKHFLILKPYDCSSINAMYFIPESANLKLPETC